MNSPKLHCLLLSFSILPSIPIHYAHYCKFVNLFHPTNSSSHFTRILSIKHKYPVDLTFSLHIYGKTIQNIRSKDTLHLFNLITLLIHVSVRCTVYAPQHCFSHFAWLHSENLLLSPFMVTLIRSDLFASVDFTHVQYLCRATWLRSIIDYSHLVCFSQSC